MMADQRRTKHRDVIVTTLTSTPIEKLTDEELAYLCSEDVGCPTVIKALRIIEAQSSALDYLLGPNLDKKNEGRAKSYQGFQLYLIITLLFLLACEIIYPLVPEGLI